MELIERNHCVVSGENDLEFLYSFKNFPVFMGCVTHPPDEDIKTDMNWWISRKIGSLQLNPLVPLDVLYHESHGSGSVGSGWDKHHEAFSALLARHKTINPLEIGAGHGKLAKKYLNTFPKAHWTVIDPNPKISASVGISVIRGYFDNKTKFEGDFDAVIHSHLIEHIYEPMKFLKSINLVLPVGGLHCFSVPRMERMMENKFTNFVNFEHTLLLTENIIEFMLQACGFEIEEKEYFMDDHSIFYTSRKTSCQMIELQRPNQYKKNKKGFLDYIAYHEKLIDILNHKIDNYENNIYLFGGHVFSQYLIAFGLNVNKIKCILDNDEEKQLKRLYGTDLMVCSPKELKRDRHAAVILRAGVFNREIKADILENINRNVIFW